MVPSRLFSGNLFGDKGVQRNIWALLKVVLFIVGVVAIYAVVFHLLMMHVEGKPSSIFTGIYWTLTTMSTLGYGDVVFATDLGRLFSLVVLISGIVLLFVVLPFTFIRFFYSSWLESQIHKRTPREVPSSTKGHVIICTYDAVASRVIEYLVNEHIPYFLIEPDLEIASEHYFSGISVIVGELDAKETYKSLRVEKARMVFANSEDTVNTNITMTVREVSETVPIIALANQKSAVEILQASGATHVLPLKRWLGEKLANRVNASQTQSHVIGQFKDLLIAELPLNNTPLVGKSIRETRLREHTGASIIGVWERGRLNPALADHVLTEASVPVIIGTTSQLEDLNFLVSIYDVNDAPVLIIGGGIVGQSAATDLQRKEIPVHMLDRDAVLINQSRNLCKQVYVGDATNTDELVKAGILEAPTVLLTSKDDALNIYLALLCRRLNADLRIVSRITHERNIETIHRAGADFVLGSASLGIEAIFSILQGKEFVVLGEGIDIFSEPIPSSLYGKTLAESNIGARTGLNVIALQRDGDIIPSPTATTVLEPGIELLMLGEVHQRRQFVDLFLDELTD